MRKSISAKLLVFGFLVASALSVGVLAASGLPYSPLANFGNFDDPYGPYQRPKVSIEPHAPDHVLPGEQIYVDVWSNAKDGAQPVGWRYDLAYDPNVLTFVKADPLLPSTIAQDVFCESASQDHGNIVSTAIVCELPAQQPNVELARYWFQVGPHVPIGLFGRVDVVDTFVGSNDQPPREIESQGHSAGFVVVGGVCGDQDGDGRVTILDAITGMQFIVDIAEPTSRQVVLSDLDGDGEITVVDVVGLLQFIVDRVDHLNCGSPPIANECPSAPFVDHPGPRVVNIDWDMHPDNSLIFDFGVGLNQPGMVWTEYWPLHAPGDRLKTAGSGPGLDHGYQVMRLHADSTYCFWTMVLGDPNGVGPLSQNDPPPISSIIAGSFHTGPLPVGLQDVSLTSMAGSPTHDLALLDHNDENYRGMAALDQAARIVWYYEQDTEGEHHGDVFAINQKENYNLVFNEIGGWRMREIRPDGTILNEVVDLQDGGTICNPFGRWHHEMQLIPGNRVLTLGNEIREINDPSSTGATALRLFTGDTIEMWDIDAGTVTRTFNLFDALDPIADQFVPEPIITGFFWQGCDGTVPAEDWTHANSLWVTEDGNVLISLRHLNQIVLVDTDTNQLIWRLGGPGSDFTFPDSSDEFHFQHSAKELPNGNILLFDNGNRRPAAEGGQYSRALELEIDLLNMTASKVWEYRYDPDLYALCCSNVTRLDNGNTVITFGWGEFHLVEADSSGSTVSDVLIESPGKSAQYRAYPLDSINGESKIPLP